MARPVLRTPICDLLGIEYPVVLAGMGGVATAELVAAVSEAGGLGIVGAAAMGPEEIEEQVKKVRSLTGKPFGVDILLPANVGAPPQPREGGERRELPANLLELLPPQYQDFVRKAKAEFGLPDDGAGSPMPRAGRRMMGSFTQQQVDAILELKVPIFASGLGNPAPYVQAFHAQGAKVIGLVGNVKNARRVAEGGSDVVVAQGHEAGGHTGRIGTMALVPQVVDAVSPTPVLAAGGIGDGRGIAAALAMGAQGVWVGTAFLVTREANWPQLLKDRILAATEEDTKITRLYSGKTMRNVTNPLIELWEKEGIAALPMGPQGIVSGELMAAARAAGKLELLMNPAGQIAGMLDDSRPAKDVLEEMVSDAARILSEELPRRVQVRAEALHLELMTNDHEPPAALSDVRVLDLTRDLGAYCTKLLADLGADVFKIEPPEGDPARAVPPFYRDEPGPEHSLYFLNLNTNKRSVVLDIETAAGRDALRALVPTADIVVESFAPGYLDSLGLGYDALRALREDIILTSITGFGRDGPHAHFLAPDIVGVAMAGLMWLAGDPRDPPNLPYGFQGFLSAGIQAAAGTMLALYHRDVTGEGQRVDVSMQEALLIAQETAMQQYDLTGAVRGRTGARGSLPIVVPGIGPYQASDGWVWGYVGTPGGAPWGELLAWMTEEGRAEDLNEDPYKSTCEQLNLRFLSGLMLNPEEGNKQVPVLQHIHEVLSRFCAAKSKWELYEQGQHRRLLIGIVSTPEDLAKNPQLAARKWYQEVEQPNLNGSITYPGPPYRLSEAPWRIARRPPFLGEHTAEVLSSAGAGLQTRAEDR